MKPSTYQIWQIENIRDTDYAFRSFEEAKDKIQFEDYKKVVEDSFAYMGPNSEPTAIAEVLFVKHNTPDRPAGQTSRSMSMSDVILLKYDEKHDPTVLFVDSFGFVELGGEPFGQGAAEVARKFTRFTDAPLWNLATKEPLSTPENEHGWFLADDGSEQWVRTASEDEMSYQLIQITATPTEGKYEVHSALINMWDYLENGDPDSELQSILHSFGYESISDIDESNRSAYQIAAECVFEVYSEGELDSIFEGDEDTCRKFIKNSIAEKNFTKNINDVKEVDTISVLKVSPGKTPELITIEDSLKSLQNEVDGRIEVVYPFEDRVGIVCNEEGKLEGLPFNRALYLEKGMAAPGMSTGDVYDILSGDFLVVGLEGPDGQNDGSFHSLSPELANKYNEHFWTPETYSYNSEARKVNVFKDHSAHPYIPAYKDVEHPSIKDAPPSLDAAAKEARQASADLTEDTDRQMPSQEPNL